MWAGLQRHLLHCSVAGACILLTGTYAERLHAVSVSRTTVVPSRRGSGTEIPPTFRCAEAGIAQTHAETCSLPYCLHPDLCPHVVDTEHCLQTCQLV